MVRSVVPLFAFTLVASAPSIASETVPLPHFKAVELRGGGKVVLVHGPAERVTIVEGSSQYTKMQVDRDGKLAIDICDGRCPRTYRLTVQIESPQVPMLAVSGGGSITAMGGFAPQRQLFVAVNGGGTVDTRAVGAADVFAAANGGGDLLVRASANLFGTVKGGGLVRYWGSPQVMTQIDGGGSIRPAQ